MSLRITFQGRLATGCYDGARQWYVLSEERSEREVCVVATLLDVVRVFRCPSSSLDLRQLLCAQPGSVIVPLGVPANEDKN